MNIECYKSPEKKDDGLTEEQRELAEYWLPFYKKEVVPEKERRDCSQEIIELQNLFTEFASDHSLNELYAIINLTAEDALNHPVRESARKDLAPIVARLNILKQETNITAERYDELQAQYENLSKAVGIINGDKVRH